jgi:DNA-binding ferritin-like protein
MANFNTHKFVKELVATGVPEARAEAEAIVLYSIVEDFATKTDIKEIKTDIQEFKAELKELKTDIKEIKTDIRRIMWGGIVALTGLVIKVLFIH